MLCIELEKKIGLKPPHVAARPHIPLRRIFDDPGKCLRPVVFHSQRHRVRQKLFERSRRHELQPLRIHAIHELLEPEHRDAAPALPSRSWPS